MDEVHLKEKAM